MSKKPKKEKLKELPKLNVPPIAVINNIVISKTEVWAYYVLAEKPYYFLSQDAKTSLAYSTMTALSSLCHSAVQKVDCHLLMGNELFDPFQWENNLREQHAKKVKSFNQPFDMFVKEQAYDLANSGYSKRVSYLGVKLMTRGAVSASEMNPLEFGFKEAFDSLKKSISTMFMFDYFEITDFEEKKVKEAEEEVFRTLSSSTLKAYRPSSEEVLLAIKRRFYPAMPSPYLEASHDEKIGHADIVMETGGVVNVRPRYLQINQIIGDKEYTGYRATLSFSKFPREFVYPSPIPPFLHRISMLPFTVNCRFTLVPTEHMRKELDKKKKDTKDEIENLAGSGQSANEGLRNSIRDQKALEADLEEENLPWIAGNYRMTIEAPTEEALKNIVAELKQEYATNDFVLSWTSGDQLLLFYEEFPGGKLEMNAFTQTTNMALLGLAGINYGGSVGDPVPVSRTFVSRRR